MPLHFILDSTDIMVVMSTTSTICVAKRLNKEQVTHYLCDF